MKMKRMLKIWVPILLVIGASVLLIFTFAIPYRYSKSRYKFIKPKTQWKFVEKTIKSVTSTDYNGIRDPNVKKTDSGFGISFIETKQDSENVLLCELDKYGDLITEESPLAIEQFTPIYTTSPDYTLRNTILTENNCGFVEVYKGDEEKGEIRVEDITNVFNYSVSHSICWDVTIGNYGFSMEEYNGKIYLAYPKWNNSKLISDEIVLEIWNKGDAIPEVTKTLGLDGSALSVKINIILHDDKIKLLISWVDSWDKISAMVIDPFASWTYKKFSPAYNYYIPIYKGTLNSSAISRILLHNTIAHKDFIIFCIRDIVYNYSTGKCSDKLTVTKVSISKKEEDTGPPYKYCKSEKDTISVLYENFNYVIDSNLSLVYKKDGYTETPPLNLTPSLAVKKDGIVGIAFLILSGGSKFSKLAFMKFDSVNNLLLSDETKELTGYKVNRYFPPKIIYAYYRWNFIWVEGGEKNYFAPDALKNKGFKLKYGCILFDE